MIGIIVLGDYYYKKDSIVKKLGRVASIPVGKKFLGRVINRWENPSMGKALSTPKVNRLRKLRLESSSDQM